VAFERRGDLRELRGSGVNFELARLSQFLYKAAEPEPLEIDPGFAGARFHRCDSSSPNQRRIVPPRLIWRGGVAAVKAGDSSSPNQRRIVPPRLGAAFALHRYCPGSTLSFTT